MDIYQRLHDDHLKIKDLLAQIAQSDPRAILGRQESFKQLKLALAAHSKVEEAVFYIDLRGNKETDGMVLEALHEHRLVSLLLEELDATPVDSDMWMARLLLVKEILEHHMEEEEQELFPRARALFRDGDAYGEPMYPQPALVAEQQPRLRVAQA